MEKQQYGLSSDNPRVVLERLVQERGEDYSALSRLIGRNAAYIQQFIKRGSPKRLGERERAILAGYFRVDEAVLGAPQRDPVPKLDRGLLAIPRLDVGAAAGAGGLIGDERTEAVFAFDERWLRRLSANPQRLAIIRVEGDSMVPTLNHGDDIMVDSADGAERLRDGIYVLRRDDVLLVKRLARGARGTVTVVSDNIVYPAERDVLVAGIEIVGRVLWTGRRL
jgi:Peptidase S24-like